MAKIEVRFMSVLVGALAMAVALILVLAPPGETQTAPVADLSLDKNDFEDTIAVGDTTFYSIDFINLGPNVATNVTITDTVPANAVILSVFAGDDGSCTVGAGNVVTCDFGDIGPGIEDFVLLEVCPTEPGILTNTATIGSDTTDPNPTNNTATDMTTVIPETAEACPDPVDPGPIDPGPFEPPVVDRDGPDSPRPAEDRLLTDSPTTIFAPSLEAEQTTDQESGDVDQMMEDSPFGTQEANTGNFAAPYQDINW